MTRLFPGAGIQALELGKHNIRVNTVRPTVVLTPLVRHDIYIPELDSD